MAWTATLRDTPIKENGNWKVIIQYTDGSKIIDDVYSVKNLSNEKLSTMALLKQAELVAMDSEATSLNAGYVIILTPPVVITPSPPTQAGIDAENAQRAWFANWRSLQQYLQLQAAGLSGPLGIDAQITSLRATLASSWVIGYRSLL